MGKTLVFGDLHGKTSWQSLLSEFKHFDKVVFLADYFDSFTEPLKNQIQCFEMVLDLVKSNPTKFIALLGNHDMAYLKARFNNLPKQGSGYQKTAYSIGLRLQDNLHYFKAAYQIGNYLFSHAGITKSLFDAIVQFKQGQPFESVIDEYIGLNQFDALFSFCLFDLNFKPIHFCAKERGGNDPFSGLFWAGSKELGGDNLQSVFPSIKQVVGHTRVKTPYKTDSNNYFCDCLNDSKNEIVPIGELFTVV